MYIRKRKKESLMKKRILLVLTLLIVSFVSVFSVTFADLDFEDQEFLKDYIIDYDAEITVTNFDYLEGIKYSIIYENDDYIIVEIDGKIVIISKD